MNGTEWSARNAGIDEQDVRAALIQVRRLDPQSTEEAVTQYLREIAEMAFVLERVAIAPGLSHSTFSPEWQTSDDT